MTDIRSFCPNANCATVTDLADGAVAIGSTRTPGVTVELTAEEWAEFRAGIVREHISTLRSKVEAEEQKPPPPLTPESRLLALVAPYGKHDAAVRAAVTTLHERSAGWSPIAERLAATWEAIREDVAEPEVLALPPEPEVGVTVEVVGGGLAGKRFRRSIYDPPWRSLDGKGWAYWTSILTLAGPSGVRVVPPAEAGEVSR